MLGVGCRAVWILAAQHDVVRSSQQHLSGSDDRNIRSDARVMDHDVSTGIQRDAAVATRGGEWRVHGDVERTILRQQRDVAAG